MKKNSRILRVCIALTILVGVLMQASTVLAGEPELYRVFNDGLWVKVINGTIIEIPAQEVPWDTYLYVDYTPTGKEVEGKYPLGPAIHLDLRVYYNQDEVTLDKRGTICMGVTDELLAEHQVDGNPYALGIARADKYGKPYHLLPTHYDPWWNIMCATPKDLKGTFVAMHKGYDK